MLSKDATRYSVSVNIDAANCGTTQVEWRPYRGGKYASNCYQAVGFVKVPCKSVSVSVNCDACRTPARIGL